MPISFITASSTRCSRLLLNSVAQKIFPSGLIATPFALAMRDCTGVTVSPSGET